MRMRGVENPVRHRETRSYYHRSCIEDYRRMQANNPRVFYDLSSTNRVRQISTM